jgi:hypothetical protein
MKNLNQHNFQFIAFIFSLFFIACNNSGGNSKDVSTNNSIRINKSDSLVNKKVKIEHSIDAVSTYFDNPVDFYALKKSTEHMHSGGDIQLNDKYFYQPDDKKYIYYDYWAIEFSYKEKATKPLSFKVLKPNSTHDDMRYDDDNEILVGIKSKIAWDGLGQSNFVKKASSEILQRFGNANSNQNNCLIYHRNNKILILNIANEKVKWFKYFWLRDTIIIENLPKVCFQW